MLKLGITLLVCACSNCESESDRSLEIERQQLKKERVALLGELPREFEDQWTDYMEGPEGKFWLSLNKKQQRSLINLMSALDGRGGTAARVSAINKTVGLLTPGMLFELAELTRTRDDMLRRAPELFFRMQSYKQGAVGYYNRLRSFAYDKKPEVFANWVQAERYYAEIKRQAIWIESEKTGQELLFDLRNALIGVEGVGEPYD